MDMFITTYKVIFFRIILFGFVEAIQQAMFTVQYNAVTRNIGSGSRADYLYKFIPAVLPQQTYQNKTDTTRSIHKGREKKKWKKKGRRKEKWKRNERKTQLDLFLH